MEVGILVVTAGILLAIGVPIGFSLALGMITVATIFGTTSLTFIAQQMWTGLDSIPLLAIPAFMLAGALMDTGGLSKRLVDFAKTITGDTYGGLGTVTVLACLFFGAISGSAPATVAAIGSIMLPYMVKEGYDKTYSTALIACASGLGVIVPPSIPLIVYGAATSTSVSALFLAGFGPAIVVATILIIINYFISRKLGYRGDPSGFNFKKLLKSAWNAKWSLLMPLIILGGIYSGAFTPTEAAVIAILYSVIIGVFVHKEFKLRDLVGVFDNNTSFVGGMMITFAPAGALGAVFALLGVPDMIASGLLAISDNLIVILMIVNLFMIVVGMVIDTISAIIVFAPLLYTALIPLGIDPVHLGLIMTINLAIGFVTPPVCANMFVASSLTKIPIGNIVKKAVPFIVGLFVALIIVTYFPGTSIGLLKIFGY